ncbi:MAG: TnsA-like heteromeric transposase endonuclease subunit [Solirubrobacteraceae bacterium]
MGGRLDRPWPTRTPTAGQRARRRQATTGTIAWLDDYGRWKHAELGACVGLPVWTFPPTREPHLHRGRMTVCGWVAFSHAEAMKVYESAAERDVLLELEFDRDVVAVSSQPFVIRLADDTEHRPDFAVRLTGGRVAIVEVKDGAKAKADHEGQPATTTLSGSLARLGWTYLTMVPPPLARRRNLRWLRGSRAQDGDLKLLAARMLATAATSARIADLVAIAHPAISRPVVGRLLWQQRLVCDLDRVLNDQTTVRTRDVDDPARGPEAQTADVAAREQVDR